MTIVVGTVECVCHAGGGCGGVVSKGGGDWRKVEKGKCHVHLLGGRSKALQASQPDLSLWED